MQRSRAGLYVAVQDRVVGGLRADCIPGMLLTSRQQRGCLHARRNAGLLVGDLDEERNDDEGLPQSAMSSTGSFAQ